MGEMPIANDPMQTIGADLIGRLPETQHGHRYALIIIDHCSSWEDAFQIKDSWELFTDGFSSRLGVPIVIDNGGEFSADEFDPDSCNLGIEHRTNIPVHPQSNGRTERFNRTLKELIQKLVSNAVVHKWEDRLSEALLACRTSVSTTTRVYPVLYAICP